MAGVEIIAKDYCSTLHELIETLTRITNDALHQIPGYYVTLNNAAVNVRLERETLTDGSEVYNLNIETA